MTQPSRRLAVLWPNGVLLLILCSACGDGDRDDIFGGVALRGESVTVAVGDSARFCVALSAGGRAVAATQNELRWDPNCLTLQGCAVDPATGKQLFPNQVGAARLRAIVISLSDTNPIADGRLYCCTMRADISGGCCAVEVRDVGSSDPEGVLLATHAGNGQVCVE